MSTEPDLVARGRAESSWALGETLLGQYRVEAFLGKGGMGEVHLVRRITGDELYAVKTLHPKWLTEPTMQTRFLGELRTWVDLPEHPNLTTCMFFRTFRNRLLIFAEYVDGGTLKDWIVRGQLDEIGGLLGVAIQFCRGLQVAHQCGMVHQDVKPSNVMMTHNRVAKITDFGLAKARFPNRDRAVSDQGMSSSVDEPDLVSSAGMTPAYASPEQIMGGKVDEMTDIWSFGVSLLEMFAGEITWKSGVAAPEALSTLLSAGPTAPFPEMPHSVAEILRRCFQKHPADRWKQFADIESALIEVYAQLTGNPYPCEAASVDVPQEDMKLVHDRRTVFGGSWQDPQDFIDFLEPYMSSSGHPPLKAPPAQVGSLKAQALADLVMINEVELVFRDLLDSHLDKLKNKFSLLLLSKAWVHMAVEDLSGAMLVFADAISFMERNLDDDPEFTLRGYLASANLNMGAVHYSEGDFRLAETAFGKAIDQLLQITRDSDNILHHQKLAWAYMNRSVAHMNMLEYENACQGYDSAIEIWGDLRSRLGPEADLYKAQVYDNKANLLANMDDIESAGRMYREAIKLYESLEGEDIPVDPSGYLAQCCSNYALIERRLDHLEDAVTLLKRSEGILTHLIEDQGRTEHTFYLAATHLNLGSIYTMMNVHEEASKYVSRSKKALISLVSDGGHLEHEPSLAEAHSLEYELLLQMGHDKEAAEDLDRAHDILDRKVNQENQTNLLAEYARVKSRLAQRISNEQSPAAALTSAEEAVEVLKREAIDKGRKQATEWLEEAETTLAEIKQSQEHRD